MAIYYGRKGGFGGQATLTTPAWITTSKRYFRIATRTEHVCRTKYYAYDNHSSFYCFMRIGNGKEENRFIPTNEQKTVVTHPKLGIEKLESGELEVDILADDQGSKANLGRDNVNAQDYFRTLTRPKPTATPSQSMGERLMRWFKELF